MMWQVINRCRRWFMDVDDDDQMAENEDPEAQNEAATLLAESNPEGAAFTIKPAKGVHFAKSFSKHRETTMLAPVFASARRSELSLRELYKHPVEPDTEKHTQWRIPIIDDLVKKLEIEARRIIDTEGLLRLDDENKFVLSKRSKRLITNNNDTTKDKILSNETLKLVQKARHALDVIAAIEELKVGACHILSIDMEKTKLNYGIHDVIALLWFCIQQADRTKTFPLDVTLNNARDALTHGIANAARAANRDVLGAEDNYDDLKDAKPDCDQGAYVSLIRSMVGILPGVEIVFDYMEIFKGFTQNFVYETLIEKNKTLVNAKAQLNLWQVSTPLEQLPKDYQELAKLLKTRLPQIVELFARDNCGGDYDLKSRILNHMHATIQDTEETVGLDFFANITLKQDALEDLWQRRHSPPSKRQKLQA